MRIIKYKMLSIITNKIFIYALIGFFLFINYRVIFSSGLILYQPEGMTNELKYVLLINNFVTYSFLFSVIIGVFLGTLFINDDKETGHIFIVFSIVNKRWKYLFLCWLTLFCIAFFVIIIIMLNIFIYSSILSIQLNFYDLLFCYKDILLNMFVIIAITAFSSIWLPGRLSLIAGFLGVILFYIYFLNEIPFTGYEIRLDFWLRNLLSNIAPLKYSVVPSLVNTGMVGQPANIQPYIIPDLQTYQIVYISTLIASGMLSFNKKEL